VSDDLRHHPPAGVVIPLTFAEPELPLGKKAKLAAGKAQQSQPV
jgi:hypothetical protein